MGAGNGFKRPGILLETLLLLLLVGNIFEKDTDADHLAQLIVQGKLGGTEPAVFPSLQIGFFVMPGFAAGHDLEIIIPIALCQFGRKKSRHHTCQPALPG